MFKIKNCLDRKFSATRSQPLVMKFGGASVACSEAFTRVAKHIAEKNKEHKSIVVVVSAMGKTTDLLIDLAKSVNPTPPKREKDMLISAGERVSISMLAMALAGVGKRAISFTGSQSGIITCTRHNEARILDVKPWRLLPHIKRGVIAIVAGFQGVSRKGEITTLGRGGSDTSAVALGIALNAIKVEFYKDVPGIYSEDPKVNPNAALYPSLTYNEAFSLASKSPVLHPRAILLAKKNKIPLHVLSLHRQGAGSIIGGC